MGAGAYVVAGMGIDDAAGTHVAAGTGVGTPVGGQVSGSDSRVEAALANAVAATGGNSGLSASLGAAASGIANHARSGGKMTASGYANKPVAGTGVGSSGTANDTVANGAVDQSGVNSSENLTSTASVSRNNTSQGNVVTTNGLAVSLQAGSVHGASLGSVMKVAPGGLFIRNPDAKGSYLFETRPQFANQKQWTSSDFLLKQLEFDPATTQKRLGDGFYEQRLVREQLAELTGHKSYSGVSDDSIYSQLLTNAVSAAKEFGLRPGVALSADQVRRLTSDIAWMESLTVMLPDGSTETVLVPKVYLAHVNARALQPGGALVTGNGVSINTTESIVNSGGVIDGGNGRTLLVAGQDIVNRGGTIAGGAVALGANGDIRNETLAVKQSYASNHNSGSYTSLSNQAAILTAGTLDIQAGRDVADLGGSIKAGAATITAGRDVSFNTVQTGGTYQHLVSGYTQDDSSVTHALSQISTSGDLTIAAGRDLVLSGTQASIGGSGTLLAGRALTVGSVTNEVKTDQHNDPSSKTYDKRVQENQAVVGSSIGASGDLNLRAGITETASLTLSASGVAAGGAVSIGASGDVNIEGAQEKHFLDVASRRESSSALRKSSSSTSDYLASTTVVGSSVTGGSVAISAGNDVKINGSEVLADKALTLAAGRDLLVSSAVQVDDERHSALSKRSGFSFSPTAGIGYSQSKQQQNSSVQSTTRLGSTLSGNSIVAIAGRDLSVQASNLVADADIALVAARNVSVVSAQDTRDSASDSSSKKSGFIGSAWQPALGTVKTTEDGTPSSVTQVGSQVGSIGGNVTIRAGEHYTQTASGILAPAGDIDIRAKDVSIKAGYDTADSSSHSTYSKVALGGTVSIPLVNAVRGMTGLTSAAKEAGGGRMSALAAMTAASNAVDTVQQITQNGLSTGIKVSVSLGSTKSESNVVQTSSTAVGSQVLAGGDISIAATGGGKGSNITAIGSEISAGGSATLRADNAVNLLAAENSFGQHSTNSSSGARIGIGFTFGGAQQGFTLDLAASKAKGRADGEELSHTNTQLNAGGKVSLQSGGDTTLKGGVVTAGTVLAAVGGDLKIESLQDRVTYDSKQTSAGINVSLCIPPFCYGASTVGGNFSKSTVNGDFQSVAQQSGIKAGDGGFQVSVGGSTDLIGGVVTSSQAAIDEKKNSFATGSLTYSSLQNKDVYKASGLALSGSFSANGGDAGTKAGASSGGGFGSASGSERTGTHSGISTGELAITDPTKQAATGTATDALLAGLTRNVTTESAAKDSGALTQRWNGEKLDRQMQAQTEITQAFTAAAAPLAAKAVGDIGTVMQGKAEGNADNFAKLASEANARGDTVQANAYLAKQHEAEATAQLWAENGAYRVGLHAAAQGLIGAAAGGGIGAAGSAAGVAGGALGRDLGKTLGETEADKLNLTGTKRDDFVNTYQQTLATIGGGLGGLAGGAAAGQSGAALANTAAHAGGTATAVDLYNRQLHSGDYGVAKKLAARSGGKYSEEEILLALRYSGLKGAAGNTLVAEGTAETFVNLTNIQGGKSVTETLATDPTMVLMSVPGHSNVLLEKAPNQPANDLIAYIKSSTGGENSPYILTAAPTYGTTGSLPPAPLGTERKTMIVDGKVYHPLTASCPAVSCTNGDSIAHAIDDPGTSAYKEALAREAERDLNVATAVLGVGGGALRGVTALSALAFESQVAKSFLVAAETSSLVSTTRSGAATVESSVPLVKPNWIAEAEYSGTSSAGLGKTSELAFESQVARPFLGAAETSPLVPTARTGAATVKSSVPLVKPNWIAQAESSSANSAGLGKTLGQYSAVEPGPLADNLAGTFGGGRYTIVELQNDTIFHRAGTADNPLGQFFSFEAPTGVLQTRIDKAVLPSWPGGGTSPIDTAFSVKIPAGTKVYVGNVGSQGGHYVGGTQQIVVPKPWTIDGVEVIDSSPLK